MTDPLPEQATGPLHRTRRLQGRRGRSISSMAQSTSVTATTPSMHELCEVGAGDKGSDPSSIRKLAAGRRTTSRIAEVAARRVEVDVVELEISGVWRRCTQEDVHQVVGSGAVTERELGLSAHR